MGDGPGLSSEKFLASLSEIAKKRGMAVGGEEETSVHQ